MKTNLILRKIEIDQSDIFRNKNEVIFLENHWYKEIFGKTFSEEGSKQCHKGIVKVKYNSVKHGKHFIYRIFQGWNKDGFTKEYFALSNLSCSELKIDLKKIESSPVEIVLEKGNRLCFYYYHPLHEVRVAFKLGVLSVFLSIISILLTIIQFVK